MITPRQQLAGLVATALLGISIGVAFTHNVPLRLTKSDREVLEEVFAINEIPVELRNSPYRDQLTAIRALQSVALEEIGRGFGIPEGTSREPGDALRYGEGECYDRTRFLEKAFRYAGLPARHASVYLNSAQKSPFRLLTLPEQPSHAVTEVRTAQGWLVVDSNNPWLGLATDSTPVSLKKIGEQTTYLTTLPAAEAAYFRPGTVVVYGLYSRHGGFFPPFNRIPDVNWRELLFNL